MVAIDKRIGCLSENVDPRSQEFLDAIRSVVKNIGEVGLNFPWHKISPRLSPAYRELVAALELATNYTKVHTSKKNIFLIFFQMFFHGFL